MCHRVTPLLLDEAQAALDAWQQTDRARVPRRDPSREVPDAYPGKQLPLFAVDEWGNLRAVELTWGFENSAHGSSRLVFNTRIETALSQARSGHGMWAGPITRGRCLVPVRSFYESWTVQPPRRGAQVRFGLPGHRFFLLAGVCTDERVSIVTTRPNASVASLHTRMPLVLGPGESSVWLGPTYESLADRSHVVLEATPEA